MSIDNNLAKITKKQRRRLTASNFSAACGLSQFKTKQKLADQILKIIPNDPMNEHMLRGIEKEPYIMELYTKYTGNPIIKSWFKLPDYDHRIGGTPDGLIGNRGLIEIKCAKSMYFNLYKDECMINPREYIFPNHYLQIMGYIEIFDKEWCDYVVYSPDDHLLKMIRIYRDKVYWNKYVYPKLVEFMETYLKWMNDDGFDL
uniref:YqaJ-like recombinase n=1 Tax=Pithovirus LCPAC406 TaxID=2506599 RepID=A0A481ZGR7_9VIRU|nr:MAG: YqaJ-like recombinase [Pithovirus LCPAC406]